VTLAELRAEKDRITKEMKWNIRQGNMGQAESLRKQLVGITDSIKAIKEGSK